jgi:hypothetical protein
VFAAVGGLGQEGAHEGAVVAQHAAAVVADAVGLYEVRVGAEPAAVPLIGGKAREAEQGKSSVAGALGGQEVPVVGAAVLLDEFNLAGGEPFEVGGLCGIDDVVHNACDHGWLRALRRSLMVAVTASGRSSGRKSSPSACTS